MTTFSNKNSINDELFKKSSVDRKKKKKTVMYVVLTKQGYNNFYVFPLVAVLLNSFAFSIAALPTTTTNKKLEKQSNYFVTVKWYLLSLTKFFL